TLEYLHEHHRMLIETSYALHERELENPTKFEDYSFVVFPISKAYEGFLKRYFFDLKLIDKQTYEGKKFRIGRALNPDVYSNQRDDDWLYDDLTQLCGETVARDLWNTWLECRNRVFHFFPLSENAITLEQAKNKIDQVAESIESAVMCKFNL
ncbi:MAG: hypothetical protein WAU07_04425, partial [Microgenomates group bacterium]